LKAARVLITGRVQAVGFRAFTERHASELDVVGYVRNLPQGHVEVLAQADAETLEKFFQKLRRGPSLARVDDFTVESVPVDPSLQDFGVRF
jgi:acylphosphatase